MPRLREIYVYPYVGWADRPWPGQRPRDSEEPWDDALLDLDAGARSARRVTESVSQALKALGVEAPRGQLMLELRVGDGGGVELEFLERFLDPSDRMTGRVRIPVGFRLLAPAERARMLGEAVGRFVAGLDKRVLLVGTGGLSHEPPVPLLDGAPEAISEFLICGRNPTPEARAARQARTIAAGQIYGTELSPQTPLNAEWDQAFIDLLLSGRLAEVDDFCIEEISKAAGRSTHEVRTWVAAFAALAAARGGYSARRDYYRPINEWIAGYGVMSADPR